MARVFLGIGHGGKDPGAVANGLREADINLVVGLSARAELIRHGVEVGISRIRDENDTLAEEIAEANAFKPDVAIDIHKNAGGGDGWEGYIQTNRYTTKSKALALAIEKEVKALGQNSRGVKTWLNANGTDYFGWLRQLNCPAVLSEGAFLDSADRYFIDTIAEQEALGVAYAKALLAYLGITWKPTDSQQDGCGTLRQQLKDVQAILEASQTENKVVNNKLDTLIVKIASLVTEYTK